MNSLLKLLLFTVCGVAWSAALPVWTGAASRNTKEEMHVVKRVPTHQKVVALTFDDGPSATFTPRILALLDEYGAKATFFVIGQRVQSFPDLVRRECEKEEIGNHGYHHTILQGRTLEQLKSELESTKAAIYAIAGKSSVNNLVRPPRGRMDQRLLQMARQGGYEVVLWSLDSHDWANPGTDRIVRNVLGHVQPGDIILFHDQGGNRGQTIAALKQIIPTLESKGYRFVTVSELLRLDPSRRSSKLHLIPHIGELED